MDIRNSAILITGGGSGIGLALAGAFAKRGCQVIICGRDPKKLETVAGENRSIAAIPCDITKDDDQHRLLNLVEEKYPSLNMLINNAGIQHNYSFDDGQDHSALVDEEVGTNFVAHVKLTDRFLPMLQRQPVAAVVNVTSALAVVPKQSAPVYCATKAALHSFSKTLRYHLEGSPVKVFEIIPALVDTEMTKGRGKNKISPEALATETLRGIEADKYEIRIQKTKILFLLHRLMPSLAARIIRHG